MALYNECTNFLTKMSFSHDYVLDPQDTVRYEKYAKPYTRYVSRICFVVEFSFFIRLAILDWIRNNFTVQNTIRIVRFGFFVSHLASKSVC